MILLDVNILIFLFIYILKFSVKAYFDLSFKFKVKSVWKLIQDLRI